MKTRYTVAMMVDDVGHALPLSASNDLPMIREALNNSADVMSRSDWRVNFNFDQDRAVRMVQRVLNNRRWASGYSNCNPS